MKRGRSPVMVAAAMVIAFLGVAVVRSSAPADPEARLPGRYRLADLIEQRQASAATLRQQVADLRAQLDAERAALATRSGGTAQRAEAVKAHSTQAGLVPVEGPGVKVTLDDSSLEEPPTGANVNDLVIHSQDVQAVVNALWRAGAEAMAINGQRLVSTSAVLCVGNTLLLNGTVHSPPYVVSAVGASRDRFEADRLVKRLKTDASTFDLKFSIERSSGMSLPAYKGSTQLTYAKPAQ